MFILDRRMRNFWRRIGRLAAAGILLGIAVIVACNIWVVESTRDRIYSDLDSVPYNDVALVLGTSNRTRAGGTNMHFKYRMLAAATLFHRAKVRHLLLSGDNHIAWYNEPHNMRDSLIRYGVPEKAMTLDYAGFRTFDSMIRAREVFRQKKFTIVTQEYHNYRALFITNFLGIDAVAFTAKEPSVENTLMTGFREYFARVKVILDLYVLDTAPRFLGEPVEIKYYDPAQADTTASAAADSSNER